MVPIEEIFCEIDDFCKEFFPEFEKNLVTDGKQQRKRSLRISASEIMTVVVLFHLSHYRDFKNFYLDCVIGQLKSYFPYPLSYNRFVEVQSRVFPALCIYLKTKTGEHTGHYYVDSRSLSVCRNQRIHNHKTFAGIAERGKSSMGWFFGFKLHVVINHKGELMGICFTTGDSDDRKIVEKYSKD